MKISSEFSAEMQRLFNIWVEVEELKIKISYNIIKYEYEILSVQLGGRIVFKFKFSEKLLTIKFNNEIFTINNYALLPFIRQIMNVFAI